MNSPMLERGLRSKASAMILGLVAFPPHLTRAGPKERWVGVDVPGLGWLCFADISPFLHSSKLLVFQGSATQLRPLGSPRRTEHSPVGGRVSLHLYQSLHSDCLLSLLPQGRWWGGPAAHCSQHLHRGLPHNWGSVSVGWVGEF